MKRRPKLSLEPDQQVRREPPKGFSSLEDTDTAARDNKSVPPNDLSETTAPKPARNPSPASPRPAPTGPTPARPASASVQVPRNTRFEGAMIGKIALAVAIAALSILLLRRHL